MARGGYRAGAGRPKKSGNNETPEVKGEVEESGENLEFPPEDLTPLEYMLKIMNDPTVDKARRDRMAVSAAPFMHPRKGEGAGKKNEREAKAKTAGAGRFAASPPPLRVIK